MKKVLFWILPLLLIACSLLSYQISKDYILQIKEGAKPLAAKGKLDNNTNFNRPVIQTPLYPKTVIVINNGLDSNSFHSFSKINMPNFYEKSINGVSLNEPINDPKQALSMLLSGIQPSLHGLKNYNKNDQADDLRLVATQNKKKTIIFSNIDYDSIDQAKSSFQQIIADWKKYDLLIFDFNNQTDLTAWKTIYLDPILQSITKTDLFFFCSLIPENTAHPFSKLAPYYKSPFLLSGNGLNTKVNPAIIKHENITATLAYGMGLSLPSDCLGFPELDFFTIPDKEKISRGLSFLENVVNFNAVKLLYQYNINETIIAGFLLESSDSIHLSPAKTLLELKGQYVAINQELKSFTTETRQRTNLSVNLIFLLLTLIILVVWLAMLLKYYRSFIFGILFVLLFLLFHYFVFRIPLSFPKDNLLSLRWFLFHSSIPLFLSAILVSVVYTISSGFVFDITLSHIFEDLHGIIGTFCLFLLGEITYIVNFFGFHTNVTSPGFFYISMLLRNLSLLILVSVTLFLMYGVSYITYKLLSKYGSKQN